MFCALLAADILFHNWTILHWIGQLLNCSWTCSWNGHKALSLSWGTTTTDTLSHCYWTVVITFPQKVCLQQSIYIYIHLHLWPCRSFSAIPASNCVDGVITQTLWGINTHEPPGYCTYIRDDLRAFLWDHSPLHRANLPRQILVWKIQSDQKKEEQWRIDSVDSAMMKFKSIHCTVRDQTLHQR